MVLLAVSVIHSNHQSPELVEPDRRRSDGKGSDWPTSINQDLGTQPHSEFEDETRSAPICRFHWLRVVLCDPDKDGTGLVELIVDHDDCNGKFVEKRSQLL